MAETEVEVILREIRERVLSQQRAGGSPTVREGSIRERSNDNGAGESTHLTHPGNNESQVADSLSLINSYLTTTARAWDRLPPLVSNRSGFIARVELWLKRHMKRATRWYAWEQINFNAAVHHALRDMLPVLSAYEEALRKLRAQLAAAEAQAEAKTVAEAEARKNDLEQYRAGLATQLNDIRAREDQLHGQLAALVNELRERDAHLRDEQRICYKQLALETSEAAVLEARARRQTAALVEELRKRVEQLENK